MPKLFPSDKAILFDVLNQAWDEMPIPVIAEINNQLTRAKLAAIDRGERVHAEDISNVQRELNSGQD